MIDVVAVHLSFFEKCPQIATANVSASEVKSFEAIIFIINFMQRRIVS